MHTKCERTRGLYNIDKVLQLQKSQDNVFVTRRYTDFLGGVDKPKPTSFCTRAPAAKKVQVGVCLGTSCFLRVVPPSSSTASCSTRRSGK